MHGKAVGSWPMNRNSCSSIPLLGFQDAQAHPFSNGNNRFGVDDHASGVLVSL